MGGVGTTEVLIIVAVLVLFFGASKIPELARGLGEGIKEFRSASDHAIEDDKNNERSSHSGSAHAETNSKEVKQPNH